MTLLKGGMGEAGSFMIKDLPAFSLPYPGAEVKAMMGRPGEGM
ncbi:MAG: hypothetical protein ACK5SX_11815 [Sandaracinobacter sp.]